MKSILFNVYKDPQVLVDRGANCAQGSFNYRELEDGKAFEGFYASRSCNVRKRARSADFARLGLPCAKGE